MPSTDGSRLICANAGHNTHGSIEEVNGQWYVFYHRPPRGFGFARQAMVAPITIQCDEKAVADGGVVVIRGYDPYAKDGVWTAKASNGMEYTTRFPWRPSIVRQRNPHKEIVEPPAYELGYEPAMRCTESCAVCSVACLE